MKTKLTYLLAALAAVWMLSSCNSRNVLMKRHYMKGYYFSHATGKNDVQTVRTGRSEARTGHAAPQYVQPGISAEPMASAQVRQTNRLAAENRTKKEIKPAAAKKRPALYSLSPVSPHSKLTHLKSALQAPVRSDDGLSLFWTVILVIVILWAIGFLTGGFGLGNLIHLLLVVALILLILWLLRII
jgi:hypothetical protein